MKEITNTKGFTRCRREISDAKQIGFAIVDKLRRKAVKLLDKVTITNMFTVAMLIVLQYVAIKAAYVERGYHAFGGECLIIPTALLIYLTHKKCRKEK